jgi:hypothetical protein
LRTFGVIDIADEQDQKIGAFVTVIGCTLSINPKHPVDILCSNPFEVAAKVLHSLG